MPSHDTLIFDGACGICTTAAEWVRRRDAVGRLCCVPYQTADLERLSPGLTRDMAARFVTLVRADGRRCRGARAVFEVLRRLPGIWRVVGAVGALPPVSLLCEPFYRVIAANRARLSVWLGMTACAVPPGSE